MVIKKKCWARVVCPSASTSFVDFPADRSGNSFNSDEYIYSTDLANLLPRDLVASLEAGESIHQ